MSEKSFIKLPKELQTVKTLIKQLLYEHFNQGLYCLPWSISSKTKDYYSDYITCDNFEIL